VVPGDADKPDAALEVGRVDDPQITVINRGSGLLREPRYTLALADLDNARWNDKGVLPVLRINVPTFSQNDWLKPGHGFGGFPIFDGQNRPEPMARIFGWASCSCPTCDIERYYYIYLVFGAEGWYYEIPEGRTFNRSFFNALFGKTRDEQASMLLAGIPVASRRPLSAP
jgi:hypothetical protein